MRTFLFLEDYKGYYKGILHQYGTYKGFSKNVLQSLNPFNLRFEKAKNSKGVFRFSKIDGLSLWFI